MWLEFLLSCTNLLVGALHLLFVAHFVDSTPISACHLSSFKENSCVIAAGPNIFTASVSAVHAESPPLHLATAIFLVLPLFLSLLFVHFIPQLYFVE